MNKDLRQILNSLGTWPQDGAVGDWSITPLFYQGVGAGSEFLTYDVDKLYLCLSLEGDIGTLSGSHNRITLYNQVDAISFIMADTSNAWDATAAVVRYFGNTVKINNKYFSRIIINVGYSNISFIGYRIIRT